MKKSLLILMLLTTLACSSVTELFSPSVTETPTMTVTPSATATPRATATPTPTLTPTLTPTRVIWKDAKTKVNVNVRQCAQYRCKIVGSIGKGETILVGECVMNVDDYSLWCETRYKKLVGFVNADYITK